MKEIADDVYLLDWFPPYAINAYLVGDVLVDSRSRHAARSILRELSRRQVKAHALTHAHPDHQGSSHEICERLGIPFWCGELDVPAAEESGLISERQPSHPIAQFFVRSFVGPGHPVDRHLHEGDEIAGFTVLDTPGHSAGHISLWRETDRTLICGDVFTNIDVLTGLPGLHEPKPYLTPDPARNRESMRRLAELEPALACFGHGRPLRDPAKLKQFTDRATRS